jgi:hypothetical protein
MGGMMLLQVKKRITSAKPVKAFKVVALKEGTLWTGPWLLEQVKPDEWVTATDIVPGFQTDIGYHCFKSLRMADKALYFMARRGLLSQHGYPHYVIPVYLRGDVAFGTYYESFKGVKGSEMLIKEKHLP